MNPVHLAFFPPFNASPLVNFAPFECLENSGYSEGYEPVFAFWQICDWSERFGWYSGDDN